MIKYHRWFNEMNSKHNPQSSFSTEDELTFALKRLVSILRQRLRLKTSNISVSSETCYVLQNGSRKRRVEARPLSSLELFYLPFRHWLGPKEVSPSPAWARGGGQEGTGDGEGVLTSLLLLTEGVLFFQGLLILSAPAFSKMIKSAVNSV